MDNLFDRFGSVLKNYKDDTELQKQNRAHKKKPADGKPETEQNKTQSKEKVQQQQQQRRSRQSFEQHTAVPAYLFEDFKRLGLNAASGENSLENCKKAYKKLLHKYHPDKNALKIQSQYTASEMTKALNTSFKRIEQWFLQTQKK